MDPVQCLFIVFKFDVFHRNYPLVFIVVQNAFVLRQNFFPDEGTKGRVSTHVFHCASLSELEREQVIK